MDSPITEALNIQTFMIVWDINLKTTSKVGNIIISTPQFSLVPNKNENTKWIVIERLKGAIYIDSNFSEIKELKGCTTYMINPLTCTLLQVFKRFKALTWTQHDWSEKIRFVFEVEMQCDAPDIQPTIWKHCITETKPAINKNEILLSLRDETFNHTVENSSGGTCVFKRYIENSDYRLAIEPETPSKNWSLLIGICKEDNDLWNKFHFHIEPVDKIDNLVELPVIITEIHELRTTLANISDSEMAAITSVIKPSLTPSKSSKELQHQSMSATLVESFTNFCDFTVQVGDQKILAHKLVLRAESTKWRDLLHEDETLTTIFVDDFDAGTIRQLIEYMYGNVKQPVEAPVQLLSAAYKYGVAGLKEFCEEQLIKTINMENVIELLLLADQCEANVLFNKVSVFIEENYADFLKLEDTKSLFVMHPELEFKLFAYIN